MKQAVVDGAREMCISVRVVGKSSKNECWNDEVKSAVEGKDVLEVEDEV